MLVLCKLRFISEKGVLDLARIRPKLIKDAAKTIIVNYWDVVKSIWDKSEMIENINPAKAATFRFEMYKKLVEKVTDTDSKKIRNRIAGYIIAYMKQILYLGRVSIEELATRYTLKSAVEEVEKESEAALEEEVQPTESEEEEETGDETEEKNIEEVAESEDEG